LKVGTLDQLMQLSDDLAKVDTQVELITKKIERSYIDLIRNKPPEKLKEGVKEDPKRGKKAADDKSDQNAELKITVSKTNAKTGEAIEVQVFPHEFIQNFLWDRNYSKNEPIRSLVDDMMKEVTKADEDLKLQLSLYNDARGVLDNIERRETGSLLVKPLGQYIKPGRLVDKEHITSLLVVIPKGREKFWKDNYEFFERQDTQRQKEAALRAPEKKSEKRGRKTR